MIAVGCNALSITSESQKLLGKLERKDKRRMAKGKAGADAELDWLSINGFDALVEAEIMKDFKSEVAILHACPTSLHQNKNFSTNWLDRQIPSYSKILGIQICVSAFSRVLWWVTWSSKLQGMRPV